MSRLNHTRLGEAVSAVNCEHPSACPLATWFTALPAMSITAHDDRARYVEPRLMAKLFKRVISLKSAAPSATVTTVEYTVAVIDTDVRVYDDTPLALLLLLLLCRDKHRVFSDVPFTVSSNVSFIVRPVMSKVKLTRFGRTLSAPKSLACKNAD